MANNTKRVKVALQQEAFCVVTGPHDSCIEYSSCRIEPIAPVILESPVVLHLYCPEAFPDEVVKIHAEHLGHFLALQSVPKIDAELEAKLYEGLCAHLTKRKVARVYRSLGHDDGADDFRPQVFANVTRKNVKDALELVRKLLDLFDPKELGQKITYNKDKEPVHVLFLALIQFLVVFATVVITDQDLATILSVASAVFLEINHGHPLCSATILKPMFIPYYKQTNDQDGCPRKLAYYKLFTGYEFDAKGRDRVASDDTISWSEHSILSRTTGCSLEERESTRLWFAAPQFGDRLFLIKDEGALLLMGGQANEKSTDEKSRVIASMLVSDNVLAYVQCAVFGTIRNMLPCHDNSDLSQTVMTQLNDSMSAFKKALLHQSGTLWTHVRASNNSCLSVTGTGFTGQTKGVSLGFGRVYTGPEDKRLNSTCDFGQFTSVNLGLAASTVVRDMLTIALDPNYKSHQNAVHEVLSKPYEPSPNASETSGDVQMFARYNHWLNKGEFTEVANVKCVTDPRYNSQVHTNTLNVDSKYQLTVSHGALPMCLLTLTMTLRQTAVMITGYMCAELARASYANQADANAVCSALANLVLHGKFKDSSDDQGRVNTMKVRYGELLKLSGPVFGKSKYRCALDSMEWFDANEPELPDYICKSLAMIGDTKRTVEKIMKDKKKSYNRVVLLDGDKVMTMTSMYKNGKYMVHAPLMTTASLTLFSQKNSTSRSLCKLAKQNPYRSTYFCVRVFSNRCVDVRRFSRDEEGCVESLMRKTSTIAQAMETIKNEVSCVIPRIELRRIKMIAPNLNEAEFADLIDTVKRNCIEVTGEDTSASTVPSRKRSAEPNQGETKHKKTYETKKPSGSGADFNKRTCESHENKGDDSSFPCDDEMLNIFEGSDCDMMLEDSD